MRLLLDTHVVLWCLAEPDSLAPGAREVLEKGAQELFCSVASLWEMAVKTSLGKLELPEGLLDALPRAGIKLLPILPEHALAVAHLPHNHGDPFDRLLVAQTQRERLTLATRDQRMKEYSIPILAA